jgi:hypothetical protein
MLIDQAKAVHILYENAISLLQTQYIFSCVSVYGKKRQSQGAKALKLEQQHACIYRVGAIDSHNV